MKKLLSLTLLSFTLLQSCTQDELDVAPKQVNATTPAGISIESVAKAISDNFILSGAKAILLKPVDNDPNTHLTTLFYANPKGGISPIIENFEVKQLEATTFGIYVLTNYSNIAFFVTYDNDWIELKNVGSYVGAISNEILFSDGSLLSTETLKVSKSDAIIRSKSGNLAMIKMGYINQILNTKTGVGRMIPNNSEEYDEVMSLDNDNVAVLIKSDDVQFMSMKNGEFGSGIDPTMVDKPSQIVRTDDNSVTILGTEYQGKWNTGPKDEDGEYDSEDGWYSEPKKITVDLDVRLNANGNAEASLQGMPSEWNGTPLVGTELSYAEILLRTNSILDVVTAYDVDGSLLYYSGTKGGQPVSGVYDLTSKTNMVVSKELFSSIGLL